MDALLAECQRVIGYHFANPALLAVALTHSSLRSPDRECNERLEFLGDSVLGLVVTEELYRLLPDQAEGELTRLKSAIVSRGPLFAASQRLGLPRFAEFARGVSRRDELPVSVTANLVEAIIGAIYLDAGYFPAREFVLRHLGRELEDTLSDRGAKNYKSLLQHAVQEARRATPTYRVLHEGGPEHAKQFQVAALIGGQEWGRAEGATKKEAEQEAARLALEAFERRGRGRRRRRGGSGARGEAERLPDDLPPAGEEPLDEPTLLEDDAESLVAEPGPRLHAGASPAPTGERRPVAPEPDVEPFEAGPVDEHGGALQGEPAPPPAAAPRAPRTPAPRPAAPRAPAPRAAEPRAMDYRAAEPRAMDYRAAEPRAMDYRAAEPRAAASRAAEPRGPAPRAPQPDEFAAGLGVSAPPPARSEPAPSEPAPPAAEVAAVPARKKAPAAWTPPPQGDGFDAGL